MNRLKNEVFVVLILLCFLSNRYLAQNNNDFNKIEINIEDIAWLSGNWICNQNGDEIEEHWFTPKAKIMLGISRTIHKPDKVEFEFLRIAETDSGMYYIASPSGRPPTYFKLADYTHNQVLFENFEHDFPQKILYELKEGNELIVRIEGVIKHTGKSMEWSFSKDSE